MSVGPLLPDLCLYNNICTWEKTYLHNSYNKSNTNCFKKFLCGYARWSKIAYRRVTNTFPLVVTNRLLQFWPTRGVQDKVTAPVSFKWRQRWWRGSLCRFTGSRYDKKWKNRTKSDRIYFSPQTRHLSGGQFVPRNTLRGIFLAIFGTDNISKNRFYR